MRVILEDNFDIQNITTSGVPDSIKTLPSELFNTYIVKLYKDTNYTDFKYSDYSNLLYKRVNKLITLGMIRLAGNEIYTYLLLCYEVDFIKSYFYEQVELDLIELGINLGYIRAIASDIDKWMKDEV